MAANLLPCCCNTEPFGRTERLSSDPADLVGMLYVSSLGPPLPLLLSVHFGPKPGGRSVSTLFRVRMEVRR